MNLLKLLYKTISNKISAKWGELDHIIVECTPVKRKFSYKADGWDLVVNNYTKVDVLEHDTWNCECYEGDNNCCYLFSQVASDLYFLFWKVTTIYSPLCIMKVKKEWMENKDAMKYIYDFTNHGCDGKLPDMTDYSRQIRHLGGYKAFIGMSPCDIGYDYLIIDDHTQNAYHDQLIIYINF